MVRLAEPIKFITICLYITEIVVRFLEMYDELVVFFLGAASDLKRATSLAKEMVMSYGMADSVSALFTDKIMTVLFLWLCRHQRPINQSRCSL